MTVAAAFTMAFIAGFSEKLVIQTATKLSDDANKGE